MLEANLEEILLRSRSSRRRRRCSRCSRCSGCSGCGRCSGCSSSGTRRRRSSGRRRILCSLSDEMVGYALKERKYLNISIHILRR